MNSIELQNKMDTIFINSKNSKTSEPCGLLLHLSDKISMKYREVTNMLFYQILAFTIQGKI